MTKFKTSEPKVNETQPKDDQNNEQLDVEYGENFEPESLFEENEMEGEEKKKRKNREDNPADGDEIDNDEDDDGDEDCSADDENGVNHQVITSADGPENDNDNEDECDGNSPGFDNQQRVSNEIVNEDG